MKLIQSILLILSFVGKGCVHFRHQPTYDELKAQWDAAHPPQPPPAPDYGSLNRHGLSLQIAKEKFLKLSPTMDDKQVIELLGVPDKTSYTAHG